ncbi:L,D-transpeptidase family protein [Sphingomonas sp. SUN039]|uniref:L,D-transpeptidase family protein n=1 Tax=Sphingomonas sp. SUN039 TaxID=2937787 RepID=UPI002164647A|nr:L,D-transpeptidase family protein [Sphingomonas sp. SUN039]UVO52906.1 L,D-transpeptidase family protein [Sphingomonas sp. SUN039]
MARSSSLSLNRVAAALIGTALLGAGVIALWPMAKPAATQVVSAPPKPVAKPATPPAPTDPALYPIRSALTIDHKMKHGEWVWNEAPAPVGGPDGDVVLITVDLKAQMMSVFRGGHEIGVAVIEHGASDKPTPLGAFNILAKHADYRSRTYVDDSGRGAPMPWAQQLTTSGVFIHGAKIRIDWGSNGCVGIPDAFAEKLFGATKVGDRVIITDGAVMQVGNSVPAA